MEKKLLNYLSLACSPLSAYEFTVLRRDKLLHKVLERSCLYIISQRGELLFDNVFTIESPDNIILSFEIKQKGNDDTLRCLLPIYQKNLIEDYSKEVKLGGNSKDKNVDSSKPLYNIQRIILFEEDNFKIWFSPEKFLRSYWRGDFKAEILGDLYQFTKYQVLYVGKATEQKIWKRLSGHETLQDILALEEPKYKDSIPKDEIAILFFEFYDNVSIYSMCDEQTEDIDDFRDMADFILGNSRYALVVFSCKRAS